MPDRTAETRDKVNPDLLPLNSGEGLAGLKFPVDPAGRVPVQPVLMFVPGNDPNAATPNEIEAVQGGLSSANQTQKRGLWVNAILCVKDYISGNIQQLYNAGADGAVTTGNMAAVAPMVKTLQYNGNTVWRIQHGRMDFYQISAVNTAQIITIETMDCKACFDFLMTCSAGTAGITIEVSADGINYFTIDSIAAGGAIAKHYSMSALGTTIAVTPLAYRYIKVTVAAAGVGNTTTFHGGLK